jgi:hypothetical protein
MRIASWIPRATNTHSEHVILIAFLQGENGYANVPQRYTLHDSVFFFNACTLWLQCSVLHDAESLCKPITFGAIGGYGARFAVGRYALPLGK